MSNNQEDHALAEMLARMEKQGLPVHIDSTVEVVPTGIATFDHSTGVGGVPRKRISIFQGEEHSGKTLLALSTIATAQKLGGRAAFIDAEHALTPNFASLLGVNYPALEKFHFRPLTLDDAYDMTKELAESGLFDVVVFDSVSALTTKASLRTSASDSQKRADVASMHAKELPKLNALLHKRTAMIFINQMRQDPNPPSWWKGGVRLYATGGKALRHASSMTVEVKSGQTYKSGDDKIGQQIKTHIIKNKVAQPYTRAEFDLMFAAGLDLTTSMIETALRLGIIRKSSSWFYIDITTPGVEDVETRKYAGRAALEDAIRTDDILRLYVEDSIALREDDSDGEEEAD